MAKEIIGFNEESDFDRMSKAVKRVESAPMVGPRHRAHPPAGGGVGGLQTIRAKVTGLNCYSNGTALVLSRPCGIERVRGEADDGTVTVTDRTDAYIFDSTIVGKTVYATYLHSQFAGTGSTEEVENDCAWEIFQVCEPQILDICTPPDPFPSTVEMVAPSGTYVCPTPTLTKTLNYISDDGCVATYGLTEVTGVYTKEHTILFGCYGGVEYLHYLYEFTEASDPPYYRYQTWQNGTGFDFADETAILDDEIGTCGGAPGTHASSVTVNWTL